MADEYLKLWHGGLSTINLIAAMAEVIGLARKGVALVVSEVVVFGLAVDCGKTERPKLQVWLSNLLEKENLFVLNFVDTAINRSCFEVSSQQRPYEDILPQLLLLGRIGPKVDLEKVTFPVPKSPNTHHCRSCEVCVMDTDLIAHLWSLIAGRIHGRKDNTSEAGHENGGATSYGHEKQVVQQYIVAWSKGAKSTVGM
uniref:Uncharacterized protein n=1 Tax=Tanacetum cinerariifolium TaxID=118510 RepID=A0A699GUQ9_TANCI|nr:hypothetical protein [Tanacetum cinerariifolium]